MITSRSVLAVLGLLTWMSAWCGLAAAGTPRPLWKTSASVRTRVEAFDFFEPGPVAVGRENEYAFAGNLLKVAFARAGAERDVFVELAAPSFIGLPTDAVAPGAKGQLGLGGTYRASNGRRDAALFLKQGWVNFHDFADRGLSLKVGRIDFVEGQEALTGDAVIDWLKRERIAHRLIGNFAFTHVQRSFDGGVLTRRSGRQQDTVLAAMPTVGVFDLDGMETLDDVRVAYAARNWIGGAHRADARVFAIAYDDERDGIVKVDNRPLAARSADVRDIQVFTAGGHVVARRGDWDFTGWGVLQGGDWGRLDHGAWAYALEAGRQWPAVRGKPWLRLGVDASSGDRDAGDGRHGTFFAVLPTPRIYARFPFFTTMNLTDAFVSFILRPDTALTLRTEYHDLRLTESTDLWYAGGGAFDRRFFGFSGRPSGGSSDLGDLLDVTLDWKVSDRWSMTVYQAFVDGGDVVRATFPDGPDARFGYVEATYRF